MAKRGRHKKDCMCAIHGGKPMAIDNSNIDMNVLTQLLAGMGLAVSSDDTTQPAVSTNIPVGTEYIVPVIVDLKGKGMAKLTDARTHAVAKFTNGVHDVRFAKAYASTDKVDDGKWEMVLRKRA